MLPELLHDIELSSLVPVKGWREILSPSMHREPLMDAPSHKTLSPSYSLEAPAEVYYSPLDLQVVALCTQ